MNSPPDYDADPILQGLWLGPKGGVRHQDFFAKKGLTHCLSTIYNDDALSRPNYS